jgi:hypothetical protein
MAGDETYFDDGREYYKATGNLVWPKRHRERPPLKPGSEEHKGPLIEESYVQLLLERLDGLEKKNATQ